MTAAFLVDTVKDGSPRQIMLKAFERTVLTYDPQNPRACRRGVKCFVQIEFPSNV
jgi:hypothetical protein